MRLIAGLLLAVMLTACAKGAPNIEPIPQPAPATPAPASPGPLAAPAQPAPPPEMPAVPAALLAGQKAGVLLPSPDGRRVLVTIGHCDGCNKPSENSLTTYDLDRSTGTWRQVGVDVDATWDGGRVRAIPRAPRMGYSGIMFSEYDPQGFPVTVLPLSADAQVGATDYVEWRIYRAGSPDGTVPLKVFPAFNVQDAYSTWGFRWPGAPVGTLRLELWAQVRPGVPDDPSFRREDGRRWAVVYSQEVRVREGAAPAPEVLLSTVRMADERTGWGASPYGRILRTADGGRTWSDIGPKGMDRCTGRLSPRSAHWLEGASAAVAVACDSTAPDGTWSPESSRISLFRTTDGGLTWTEASVMTPYTHGFPVSVAFADEQTGWLLARPRHDRTGSAGALYRTQDGGRTWEKRSETASGLPAALEVSFAGPNRGWAVGPDRRSLYTTDDGGTAWRQQPLDLSDYAAGHPPWVSAPLFHNGADGYLVVRGFKPDMRLGLQQLWTTGDGGATWQKRSTRDGERVPAFLSPAVGYVWEYEFSMLSWTRDGGLTWEPLPRATEPGHFTDVHFVDSRRGFAIQQRLYTTSDGGLTWSPVVARLGP